MWGVPLSKKIDYHIFWTTTMNNGTVDQVYLKVTNEKTEKCKRPRL